MGLKERSSAMDKYRVSLTSEERGELERLVAAGKAAARKLTHPASSCGPTPRPAGSTPTTRSSPPWAPAPGPSPVSASGSSPRVSRRPSAPGPSHPGRTGSRSRGTSSRSWSSWLAVIHPKAAATGPCNCWPTNWSCWAWRSRSAPRRCGRRLKKRHPALGRRDLVRPPRGRRRVCLADGGRDPDVPPAL